ncbi:MAG: thioesterase [Spirochaetaceae bacterium]
MPYTEKLKIRTSDCDKNLRITPSSILDLLQESAGRHSEPYKLDSPSLISEQGLTWVLIGMALKFDNYPVWPGSVKIDTWAKSLKGFKALRDYSVFDDDGKNIIHGSSIWALLNIETKRPTKIETVASGMATEDDQDILSGIIPGRPEKLDHSGEHEEIILVNRSDLDINNHVSNIQYITWLFTYLQEDYLEQMELSFVNISYKGETYLNDELRLKTTIIDNKGYHTFINIKTNKEICSISSMWRLKQ